MTKIVQSEETQLAVLKTDIGYIKASIESINKKLDDFGIRYVTRDEFFPVKTIVYGLVSLILLSVIGAILALVVMR